MIFGIDLDGTYAADIPAFRRVVSLLQDHGHICVLVTNRPETDRAFVEGLVAGQMVVFCTNGRPKREVAREGGYVVDVWVDDNPILVDFGAAGLEMVKSVRAC